MIHKGRGDMRMVDALAESVEHTLEKFCNGSAFFWGQTLNESTGMQDIRYAVGDGVKEIIVSIEHIGHFDMKIIKVKEQHSGQYIFIYENGGVDGGNIDEQSLSTIRLAPGATTKLQIALTCLLETSLPGR